MFFVYFQLTMNSNEIFLYSSNTLCGASGMLPLVLLLVCVCASYQAIGPFLQQL